MAPLACTASTTAFQPAIWLSSNSPGPPRYALAARLHVSGPLAMVVAGLVVGNQGRALAMSDTTRHHIDLFWELLDEIPNAVVFVLIGLK